jgi:hypothetical protein
MDPDVTFGIELFHQGISDAAWRAAEYWVSVA